MDQTAVTRLEQHRDIEAAVRLFRWVGVVFALVQVGVLYAPPAGLELPYPRWPVAIALALALVALNLVSLLASRSDGLATLRRWGRVQLGGDTLIVVAILAAFAFDPESRLWPLFLLPILEGGMRERMPGALVTAGVSAGVIAVHNTVAWADPLPNLVSGVAFQSGVLLIAAIGIGALAGRLEVARLAAEDRAAQLRRLSEVGRSMASHRRVDEVIADALVSSRILTGADRSEIHLRSSGSWVLASASGEAPQGHDTLLDALLDDLDEVEERDVIEVDGDDPRGRRIVAAPLRGTGATLGLLVLAVDDAASDPTVGDTLTLLTAHTGVALDNAQTAETEARTIDELRALDRMKDEFVDILAHELRNPMHSLMQYAHLVRERSEELSDEQREEFLDAIERITGRLAKLVGDIRAVTEMDRGALPVTREQVQIAAVVREVAVEQVAGSERHRLEIAIDAELPPVWGDPDRIRQVLTNLLDNALKYSPDGGRIRLDAHRVGDEVEVVVTDDGVGVPRHLQRHLFEKFVRLPPERGIRGTGLGLYLSREFVRAMGGEMAVESEEGRGSRFSFTLPAAPLAAAGDGEPAADSDAAPTERLT